MRATELQLIALTDGTLGFPALRRGPRTATARRSAILVPGWREPRSGHGYLLSRLAAHAAALDPALEVWQWDPGGQGESLLPAHPDVWSAQLAAIRDACATEPWVLTRGATSPLLTADRRGVRRGVALNPLPPTGAAVPAVELCERLGGEWEVLRDGAVCRAALAALTSAGGTAHHADLVIASAPWAARSARPAAEHRPIEGDALPTSARAVSRLTEILIKDLMEQTCWS